MRGRSAADGHVLLSWASSQAAPKPTYRWWGSVPLRRPRSCPPPLKSGSGVDGGHRARPRPWDRHLCGVSVEEDFLGPTQRPNVLDRLPRLDLVVHSHDSHQDRVVSHGVLQLLQITRPVALLGFFP